MRTPIIIAMFVIACCTLPFSRPVPTDAEYKLRFLSHLQPEQIKDLRFSYHGAVGGQYSIARFKVDADAISQIRVNTQHEDIYTPLEGNTADEFKQRIAMCAGGGAIPKWFDFPFDRSLPVFIDSGGFTEEHPAYSHEWYIDEDQGIAYYLMMEG
ncbi:hypothetical protein SH528x_003183 [Novipirellula sp. SH528]|uniref:hypothetical protein n=1 Tax=Novipirellula sp. SH528 TaxID=3454466 RepID=UPI003F9EF54B